MERNREELRAFRSGREDDVLAICARRSWSTADAFLFGEEPSGTSYARKVTAFESDVNPTYVCQAYHKVMYELRLFAAVVFEKSANARSRAASRWRLKLVTEATAAPARLRAPMAPLHQYGRTVSAVRNDATVRVGYPRGVTHRGSTEICRTT